MASARTLALDALLALYRGRITRLRDGLRSEALHPRDLAFAAELCHGVLRRERLLDHVLGGCVHRGLPRDIALRVALRLGAYQLLFVAGMPDHAAVHETVAAVRGQRGFANAVLRRLARAIEPRPATGPPARELALDGERALVLPTPLPEDEGERLAVVHSLPDWLCRRWHERFGLEALRQIAAAASARPVVFLRAVAGIERGVLQRELAAAGVETEPADHERLLRWTGGASPFGTAPYRSGWFVVQDPTALAAAAAVPVRPGDVVVDLCAAPGTKTTLLAERVQPGGRVVAFDPHPARRRLIADNIERLGLHGVVEIATDPAQLPVAAAVLADVPCSNTGVLGRRVEVRRRLVPAGLVDLPVLQRQLLGQAIGLCRPGGTVVYSTCSIEREENTDVVAAAITAAPGCLVRSATTTLPAAGRGDGGFVAVLRRGGVAGPAGMV